MQRKLCPVRDGYEKILEAEGFTFHESGGYWTEGAYYSFRLSQIDAIEAATAELHAMCLRVLPQLATPASLRAMGFDDHLAGQVLASVAAQDFSLYGRFDLGFDGESIKLFEYNADTPTCALESAVCQWNWLESRFPDLDQFNSLHEKLIEQWRRLPGEGLLHFASLRENEEDWVTTNYLLDTALQAGREVHWLALEDIGFDASRGEFVDDEERPIRTLFKLYPWEWMAMDEFGRHVDRTRLRVIEPHWKAPLSSKALLVALWQAFPGHPLLLPAALDDRGMANSVRKPYFSREGSNIEIRVAGEKIAEEPGPYDLAGAIYQEYFEIPKFGEWTPVIGSWVVGGVPAGMCVRESTGLITTNTSRFTPHVIEA